MFEIFDFHSLARFARENKTVYAHARPFPHIIIDRVGNKDLTEECARAFPPFDDPRWFTYPAKDRTQKNKQVLWDVTKMPEAALGAVIALSSAPFIQFLEILTGIPHLTSDPFLYGGGMQQVSDGGMLEVHVDCDFNPRLQLYRRVTVLWYLSDWLPMYKGNLELWKGSSYKGEERLIACAKSIIPNFNRMVIFSNTEASYHGHPAPIQCPPEVTRKSLATFYFTAEPDPSYSISHPHKARFLPLPGTVVDPTMELVREDRAKL